MLVGITLLVYGGKFDDAGRRETCRAKSLSRAGDRSRTGLALARSRESSSLKEGGSQSLWIQVEGELADWKGKGDKVDI